MMKGNTNIVVGSGQAGTAGDRFLHVRLRARTAREIRIASDRCKVVVGAGGEVVFKRVKASVSMV